MLFLLRCVFWLGLVFAHINWSSAGADSLTTAGLLADLATTLAVPAKETGLQVPSVALQPAPVQPTSAHAVAVSPAMTLPVAKPVADKAVAAKVVSKPAIRPTGLPTSLKDLVGQAGSAAVQHTKDFCQTHMHDCLAALIAASELANPKAGKAPASQPASKGTQSSKGPPADWRG